MTFNSYTDVEAFRFIYELTKRMPGILKFANVNIRSLDIDVDTALLDGIKKGGYKDIVQVRLTMVWQDFKTLNEKKGEDAQQIKK